MNGMMIRNIRAHENAMRIQGIGQVKRQRTRFNPNFVIKLGRQCVPPRLHQFAIGIGLLKVVQDPDFTREGQCIAIQLLNRVRRIRTKT